MTEPHNSNEHRNRNVTCNKNNRGRKSVNLFYKEVFLNGLQTLDEDEGGSKQVKTNISNWKLTWLLKSYML